jgi:polar amino acid transport system substrate-binding protein
MRQTMARLIGFRGVLCAAIMVGAFNVRASSAEPLRLVTAAYSGHSENIAEDKAPGFSAEVVQQVFAAMGQDVSLEAAPSNRVWMMVLRGEVDGGFPALRNDDEAWMCSYPDEPLGRTSFNFFIRTVDIGRLKFSSFDDLMGHDVAITGSNLPGFLQQPTLSPELRQFFHEHHNMVETGGAIEALRMLAAGRVDYAVLNLNFGVRMIPTIGLSGKIEPLLSQSAFDASYYVCFRKARVSPSLVDAFSRALKQFKQTEAFEAIYRKYFP